MPLSISVPQNSSFTDQDVELGGRTYNFVYKLNERLSPARLYLDIFSEGRPVALGLKLLPEIDLTDRYILSEFDHGALYLIRYGSTGVEATLGTIGFNNEFELVYASNEELQDNV